MKRNNSDENSAVSSSKKKKEDSSIIKVRLLIPAKAVGVIIGKGGKNMDRIRSEFSVSPSLQKNENFERVFSLKGELPAILNALRDQIPKLQGVLRANISDIQRQDMGHSILDESKSDSDYKKMIDIRMLIHQSSASVIIGKGGKRIREFRSKNKMTITKVFPAPAPDSTDRVVQLVADPENVISCLESIITFGQGIGLKGPIKNYDSANGLEEFASEYGGWSDMDRKHLPVRSLPISGYEADMCLPYRVPRIGYEEMYPHDPRTLPSAPQQYMYVNRGRMDIPDGYEPTYLRRMSYPRCDTSNDHNRFPAVPNSAYDTLDFVDPRRFQRYSPPLRDEVGKDYYDYARSDRRIPPEAYGDFRSNRMPYNAESSPYLNNEFEEERRQWTRGW